MNKLTFASLGLAASVIASVALFNCNNDPMGNTPTDTADMAVGSTDMATGSGDMALTNPDLAGVAAPTKVTGFKQPTSAFWDAATSSWYVSNVGGATVTDPKTFSTNMTAFISKVPANLMNPNHAWYPNTVTPRLNAPFGLRGGGGKLYVGNIDKLWAIDMANPTTVAPLQSATVAAGGLASLAGYPTFMIDVALDSSNNAYVADATGRRLLKFTAPFAAGANPTTIVAADTFAGTSGVYIDGTKVVIAEAGINQVIMQSGGISTCNLDGSGRTRLVNSTKNSLAYQGIEKDTLANKYMIASPGDKIVYSVDPSTGAQTILRNVAQDGATTATDIGWDPVGKVLAVPDTGADVVYFYKL